MVLALTRLRSPMSNITYNLLSGPQSFWLENRWRQCLYPRSSSISILSPQGSVDELEVLIPSKVCRFVAHPHSGDDVILDQTSQGSARSGDEVLVIGVCNHHGLSSCHFVLCSPLATEGQYYRGARNGAYEGNGCSFRHHRNRHCKSYCTLSAVIMRSDRKP